MPIRTVSPSAISTYLCCPRLYQYLYLEKSGAWLGESQATRQGRFLHLWLDRHSRGLATQLPPGTEPRLQAMWDYYLAYLQELPEGVSKSEWAFHIPLQLEGEKVILTGRLDRLFEYRDHLLILDWKTGSLNGPGVPHEFQMACYAWALWQMRPFFKELEIGYIETRLVSLKCRADRRQSFEAEELVHWGQRFESAIACMNADKYRFLRDPLKQADGSQFCRVCQFQKLCPEGKNAC